MKTEESHVVSSEMSLTRRAVERRPRIELQGLVEKFWSAPSHGEGEQKTFEILPDGNFDLVFFIGDSRCKLIFAGPYTQKACVPIFHSYDCFGIRFRPGRMPRLADIKPAELIDTMIDLPGMLGMDINTLGEHLHRLKSIDSRQELIEKLIGKAGPESVMPGGLCSRSAELVESCGGRIKVGDLAHHMGVSIRTLERVFLEEVGLPPKRFIRCVRFQNALARLSAGTVLSLTELAYDCGYADQSHFIKDFKTLSGRLPSCADRSHLSRFYNPQCPRPATISAISIHQECDSAGWEEDDGRQKRSQGHRMQRHGV